MQTVLSVRQFLGFGRRSDAFTRRSDLQNCVEVFVSNRYHWPDQSAFYVAKQIVTKVGFNVATATVTGLAMVSFKQAVEGVGLVLDGAGVLVIVLGLLFAGAKFVLTFRRAIDGYRRLRQDIGRGILLGLELLVAADIIRTVAIDPTIESVSVLGLIVLIRTFLSMSLQLEIEGRWPWQKPSAPETGS